MAKCQTCGTEVSFFNINRECEPCEKKRQQAERIAEKQAAAQKAENERQEALRAEAERKHAVEKAVQQLAADVAEYGATTLVRSFSIAVDSFIQSDITGFFTLAELRPWLRRGWKIIATIPRTKGVALHNTQSGSFGTHYGGGMGGNVFGVHIVLQLEVTPESLPRQTKAIEAHYIVEHGGSLPN